MKENKPYHYFICQCNKDQEFHKVDDLNEHMRSVHNFEIKGVTGKRELMMHINKRPRHASSYRWIFEGLEYEVYEHKG